MQIKQTKAIMSILLATLFSAQLITANVLFRIGFNFHVGSTDDDPTSKEIDENIIVQSNGITITANLEDSNEVIELNAADADAAGDGDNGEKVTVTTTATAAPPPPNSFMSDIWAKESNLSTASDDRLQRTREAILNLNRELMPVVGRSDYIAAKVKLITRFLNEEAAVAATSDAADVGTEDGSNSNSFANKFKILRKFIKLVDKLKLAPSDVEGGKRSLEFALMNLALQKHELEKLQREVEEEVLHAEEAWQRYAKTKLVEIAV